MKTIKKYLFATTFLILCTSSVMAQKNLEINKVFDTYGKANGSIMVEMTQEMLYGYDFDYYRSIVITNNEEAADFTRSCLQKDEKNSKKVKRVVTNGRISSIFMQLPSKGKLHRLILFNDTSSPNQKMTLIYIESKNDSEEILKLILKKK